MSDSAYLTGNDKKMSRWVFQTTSLWFSVGSGCCWRR